MNNNVMFSSKTDVWATPQRFFDELNREFNFELDVCATPENAKCRRFYTKEQDGLAQPWTGRVWFHDYIYGKAEVRFIRGRLKFGESKNSAPFPSMVVIFGEKGGRLL